MGLCKIQDYGAQQLCAGCWRTLDEIAQWRAMSEPERLHIMAQLATRAADKDSSASSASSAQTGNQTSA